MKRFQIIISISLLLGCPMLSAAQSAFCNTDNQVIHHGEEIRFKVFYNLSAIWIGAGEATFTTRATTLNGKDVFHIVGTGRTYDSYDWIYRVRDKYETYIDAKTMKPLKFKRDVNEGGYTFKNEVIFDRERNKAYSHHHAFSVPDCVQDILSAIFYARNIDYDRYQPGTKIPFSLFLDDKVYDLYIRYIGKEKITTKYGTFHAIKIAPLLIKGTIFEGGENMLIWVSDDRNHVPLRVNSPILVGSVKVDMIGYKNLRYPLSSLISRQ